MKEIKPSTCTQFPVGCKVKITRSGHSYTTYAEMIRFMGLDMQDYRISDTVLRDGDVCTVVAKALHGDGYDGEVLAVRFGDGSRGPVGLIRALGVVEYEVSKNVLTESTIAQLKAELATVKAKLWDVEQKLKKIVAVATE
jgi:hypothetical protein